MPGAAHPPLPLRYSRGLTIIRSNQCPHIAKFADEIAQSAEQEYGLAPRIVDLKSARQAQNAPTPYAVFAVIYNGCLLADHQISRTRFHNIMRQIAGQCAGPALKCQERSLRAPFEP